MSAGMLIADAVERAGKIASDYDAFLAARGQIVLAALKNLCDGRNWSGGSVDPSVQVE